MKISAWNCISCGNVVLSRYVDPDHLCLLCAAAAFSDRYKNVKIKMMHGTSDPRNN